MMRLPTIPIDLVRPIDLDAPRPADATTRALLLALLIEMARLNVVRTAEIAALQKRNQALRIVEMRGVI